MKQLPKADKQLAKTKVKKIYPKIQFGKISSVGGLKEGGRDYFQVSYFLPIRKYTPKIEIKLTTETQEKRGYERKTFRIDCKTSQDLDTLKRILDLLNEALGFAQAKLLKKEKQKTFYSEDEIQEIKRIGKCLATTTSEDAFRKHFSGFNRSLGV